MTGDAKDSSAARSFEMASELCERRLAAGERTCELLLFSATAKIKRKELSSAFALCRELSQKIESLGRKERQLLGKAFSALVSAFAEKNELPEALTALRAASQARLDCAQAALAVASKLLKAGDDDSAKGFFALAVEMKPENIQAAKAFAAALMKRGEHEEAETVLKTASSFSPEDSEIKAALAACAFENGRFEEYESLLEKLVALSPSDPLPRVNLGTVRYKLCKLDAAAESFREALRIDPSCAEAGFGLSMALLKAGRFEEGWPFWECRLKLPPLSEMLTLPLPLWNGEGEAGRLLVRCEQGFGDIIQFARFLTPLKERCESLVFVCRKELIPLYEKLPGVDRVVPLERAEKAAEDCERWIPLGSLPKLFLRRVEDLAKFSAPTLAPSPERDPLWSEFVNSNSRGKPLKIGLCWGANPKNRQGKHRSMPLKALLPLIEAMPEAAFFSLQMGEAPLKELDALPSALSREIARCEKQVKDFADTAALISKMDFCVTVDTSVAHLAGATGGKACVALCYEADWRWLLDRSDSPWHPSLKLFRQKKRLDWSSPVQEIVAFAKSFKL